MNIMRRAWMYAAIAPLGGFVFGYDTAVIAGAVGYLTQYFYLSPAGTGWTMNLICGAQCAFDLGPSTVDPTVEMTGASLLQTGIPIRLESNLTSEPLIFEAK